MTCLEVASRMRRIVLAIVLLVALVVPVVPAGAIAYPYSGQVLDLDTSLPVESAFVALFDSSTEEFVDETVTDANGDFYFAALDNGSYDVLFGCEGYQEVEKSFTYSGTPVVLGASLTPLQVIAVGSVTSASSGEPIQDVSIMAFLGSGFLPVASANPDETGAYTLYDDGGTGAGEYRILVRAPGYEDQTVYRTWDGTTPLPLDFEFGAAGPVESTSIAGENRFETAVKASQEVFPDPHGCDSVVIASGRNFPDALGGSALAGALGCPVLLTEPGTLPPVVADEIVRLGATDIFIVGGLAAVSTEVAGELDALPGTTVERISGNDRYETAALVAERTVAELDPDYFGDVFIATGTNFPDALAAAPLAAWGCTPILLVKPDEIPEPTLAALDAIEPIYGIVLGGESAVGPDVYDELEAGFGVENIERIAGDDRYETAAKIAQYGVDYYGMDWNALAFATGANFPDALAGGAAQGLRASVVLLTKPTSLEAAPEQKLVENGWGIFRVLYFGGPSAISDAVRAEIEDVIDANR